MDLPVLDISCGWNHTRCERLCLVPLPSRQVFRVRPRRSVCGCSIFHGAEPDPLWQGWSTLGSFHHRLLDVWGVGTLSLSGMMLLGTSVCEFLCGHVVSSLGSVPGRGVTELRAHPLPH